MIKNTGILVITPSAKRANAVFAAILILLVSAYSAFSVEEVSNLSVEQLVARGDSLYDEFLLEEAFLTWTKAVELYRTLGKQASEAEILKKIGWIFDDIADYHKAIEYYQHSLQIAKDISDHKLQGQVLNNLGIVYMNLSEYDSALDYLQQSLQVRRNLGDKRGEGRVLNNMGMVYDILSDRREALKLYSQSLDISREIDDRRMEARVLGNMGVIYKNISDFPRALDYYDKSLMMKRELGDRYGESSTLTNIGVVYDLLGDHNRALEYYFNSLNMCEELGDKSGESENIDNIGAAYEASERNGEALEWYSKSLVLKEELGDRRGAGQVHNNIGIIYYHQGLYKEALNHCRIDLEICREIGDRNGECVTLSNIGMIYVKLDRIEEAGKAVENAIEMAEESDLAVNIQLAWLAQGRIYAHRRLDLQAVKCFEKVISSIESVRGDLEIFAQKSSYASRMHKAYNEIISALIRLDRDDDAFEYVERSRSRAFLDILEEGDVQVVESQHEDFLKRNSRTPDDRSYEPDLASLSTAAPLKLIEVQRMLRPQSALLEYFLTDTTVYVWRITREEAELSSINIAIDDVIEQVEGFRDAITVGGAVRKRSDNLYKALLEPVIAAVKDGSLVIVPHGILHYLPFHALLDNEGRYLIERFPLTYLPSASVLKYIDEKENAETNRLLAFGNPEAAGPDKAKLPQTEVEVEKIGKLFSIKDIFVGMQATEAKFHEIASQYDIIHLACHGELNAAHPLFSGLYFTSGGDFDGKLEVHEIFSLKLDAQLVTLSACQTGMGKLTNGDDLVGLSRAFIFAGTTSVLASIWMVADESTAFLMEKFYQYLRQNSKERALQKAQLDTMKEYPEVYAWAPFILIGSP
ncbi:hypothetical protein CEE37_09395 [candidate division LCP-89 bacterium B3_LCP]|uniref:CHAT domain-containing protein n=1 Tax=candidate division LCP-89 bacterium B3_LCP TaxID=2012998 RepID=A0A532UYB8_UNCL8|nr:MAG: hypothetical protein CEE37_09395 [candidate division LCP-89 bacterium B3_LCP]